MKVGAEPLKSCSLSYAKIRLVKNAFRLLLAAWLLAACALAQPQNQPNVILITLDTTRADRMGFLGNKRGLTPNLDAVAKQGVVFRRAYSQYPLTVPSHATILSGTFPQFHRVNDFGIPLSKDVPYLPEILQSHGYHTAAFVATSLLDPTSGWVPGFGRGFDTYQTNFQSSGGEDTNAGSQSLEHPADFVVGEVRSWLKDQTNGPFFIWIHLYDPHAPYDPPEPFKTRFASDPYDGEIAFADSELGKVFADLKSRGLYDNTLIAMMSDHGEAFGEHGEFSHGIFLYDETIHVPLMFKMPGNGFAGKQVDAQVGLVDIVPTILEGAGIAVPATVQGKSLAPLMNPDTPKTALTSLEERPAYSETDYPHRDFGWSALRALREKKYLYVKAPRQEVYDRSADPKAEHNLASSSPAVAQVLDKKLDTFRAQTSSARKPGEAEVDPRLVQQLAALGYVGGARSSEAPGSEMTGADPKDKIEVANGVQDALMATQQGRADEAVSILEKMIKKDPDLEVGYRTLGLTYSERGDFDKAIPMLRKSVELNPAFSLGHLRLGQALFETGDLEGAKKETETAIAKSGMVNLKYEATLHFFLAAVLRKIGKNEDSFKELRVSDKLDPDNYKTNLTLGRLLAMDGDPTAGLPYLQKAARLDPTSFEPHLFLSDAFQQLGRQMEATAQRAEAERLQAQQKPD